MAVLTYTQESYLASMALAQAIRMRCACSTDRVITVRRIQTGSVFRLVAPGVFLSTDELLCAES